MMGVIWLVWVCQNSQICTSKRWIFTVCKPYLNYKEKENALTSGWQHWDWGYWHWATPTRDWVKGALRPGIRPNTLLTGIGSRVPHGVGQDLVRCALQCESYPAQICSFLNLFLRKCPASIPVWRLFLPIPVSSPFTFFRGYRSTNLLQP